MVTGYMTTFPLMGQLPANIEFPHGIWLRV
jgi:hypothetical protein